MDFIKIESSNISKVCYENGDLYIVFNTGMVYRYDTVPDEIYEEFLEAPSKGKFFYKYIKDIFDFKSLGSEESFLKTLV